MTDHLFPLMWWALGQGFAAGRWPRPGGELLTGGSPRFQIYRTADARFLAAAPLEQRFWARFAELIGLEAALRDDQRDPEATKARVCEIIRRHDAAYWQARFAGEDVCCNVVASLEEAVRDPHFVGRGLFAGVLRDGAGRSILRCRCRWRRCSVKPALPAIPRWAKTTSCWTGDPVSHEV